MSDNKKSKSSLVFLILLLLFVVLFITNPTADDFEDYVKQEFVEYGKEQGKVVGMASDLLSNPVAVGVGKYTHRTNFLLCSVYVVNIGDGERKYLGILNQFISL